MPHPRVDALVDGGAHAPEDFRRFVHAFERNMAVDVAAAEKDRYLRIRPQMYNLTLTQSRADFYNAMNQLQRFSLLSGAVWH